MLQLEAEHPLHDDPPIGVDMPLSPLVKEAKRDMALGTGWRHFGQGASSADCEMDRNSSNLTLQSGQQYS